MTTIYQTAKRYPIYSAEQIKAWEQRWFARGNSSYGLMQQASLMMATAIENLIVQSKQYDYTSNIMVWCGVGNNGGDGYLIAKYLKQKNFNVMIHAPELPQTEDAKRARQEAEDADIDIYPLLDYQQIFKQLGYNSPCIDIHIDALFGNGLNRELSNDYQTLIYDFNVEQGLKIAIDVPSGLHPDTGVGLPIAVKADYTLCVMGLKLGLLTGKGRYFAGQVIEIPLIPQDEILQTTAYLETFKPTLFPRLHYAHKGNFGHVLIIGGHSDMGGAVIMAGESAMACGAGKVTIMCHSQHHTAILSRSPNIMVKNIDDIFQQEQFNDYLKQIDSVAFGMGLGRDEWAKQVYQQVMSSLTQAEHLSTVVVDADALYFLAQQPKTFNHTWIFTPHSAEAGRLLQMTAQEIEQDRRTAIEQLQQKYAGNWVLKGAGSLILTLSCLDGQGEMFVCAFGNAGMATAGMGDVLSGMIASLKLLNTPLEECVALHALAGDELAKHGQRGIFAHDMVKAIYMVINE